MIRTFVNDASTVLVQLMTVEDGGSRDSLVHVALVHVATREHPSDIWSPPIVLREERS